LIEDQKKGKQTKATIAVASTTIDIQTAFLSLSPLRLDSLFLNSDSSADEPHSSDFHHRCFTSAFWLLGSSLCASSRDPSLKVPPLPEWHMFAAEVDFELY
jgi:hypothetical protein